MKRMVIAAILLLSASLYAEDPSDTEIRQLQIQQSISSYSGSCPCPYNVMGNGRRCGGNTAYSKPGGAEPLCYESDVSDEMVERYHARLKK